ncbi:MAG: hypothetical protein M1812_005790 [Candelaria pacifica]|nr:MAG: hypothetical protein M1812_005790 [Candelaria pacifica]
MTTITLDAIHHYDPLAAASRSSSSRRLVTSSRVAPLSTFSDSHATNSTPVCQVEIAQTQKDANVAAVTALDRKHLLPPHCMNQANNISRQGTTMTIKDCPEGIEDDEYPSLEELLSQAKPNVSSTDINLTPHTVKGEPNGESMNGSQSPELEMLEAGPSQDAPIALDNSLFDAELETWQRDFNTNVNGFGVTSPLALGPTEGHGADLDLEFQHQFLGSGEVSSDEGDRENNNMAEHGSLSAVQPTPPCSNSISDSSRSVSRMGSSNIRHSGTDSKASEGAQPLEKRKPSRSPHRTLTSHSNDDYDNMNAEEEGDIVGPRCRKRRKLHRLDESSASRRCQQRRGPTPSPSPSTDDSDEFDNYYKCPSARRSRSTPNSSSDRSSDSDKATTAIKGLLKRVMVGPKMIYTWECSLEGGPDSPFSAYYPDTRHTNSINQDTPRVAGQSNRVKRSKLSPQFRGRRSRFTLNEDAMLVDLKENRALSWKEILLNFPDRSLATLQVHYSTKLRNRANTFEKRSSCKTNRQTSSRPLRPSR